jgi:protein-S-isoprenylcysteine O-methyltransferase Ste14
MWGFSGGRPDDNRYLVLGFTLEPAADAADLTHVALSWTQAIHILVTSDRGPAFRMWPPVAIGAPLVLGLLVSWRVGDPLDASSATGVVGWLLVTAFALWNGWALVTIARHRTALLPGGPTATVIDSGPFARSRNPLYIGLLAGSAGVALLAGSLWALSALPLEWALLRWGAVVPEEHYLTEKFGAAYADYTSRVRRWL